jgi:hypothetical protein
VSTKNQVGEHVVLREAYLGLDLPLHCEAANQDYCDQSTSSTSDFSKAIHARRKPHPFALESKRLDLMTKSQSKKWHFRTLTRPTDRRLQSVKGWNRPS